MKRISLFTGFAVFFFCLLICFSTVNAQRGGVRASLKAQVTQLLGTDADITIDFSRPGVKGRDIWGALVPYGLSPGNKYSKEKPFPWRAGANENTTLECNKDLLIQGQALPSGKYSIHMIPSESEWTVIFNKNSSLWGSFLYDSSEDALRVTVTPTPAPHCEWLMFGFENLTGTSAVAYLHWEKLKVPIKIELAGE
jgi:hypothetical protein